MKELNTPTPCPRQKPILQCLLIIIIFFALFSYLYFLEREITELVFMVLYGSLVIILGFQYFTVKGIQVEGISKENYNDALEYALDINNIKTSSLPDGVLKTKKWQVEDPTIILKFWHLSWLNSGSVILKKAKNTVLYDKIFASMKDYMSINNVTKETKHFKLFLLILTLVAVGAAIGFGIGYFTNIERPTAL